MYISLDLLIVLCECQTWSLGVRDEHGLRMFKSKEVRKIFGPKRGELKNTGGN
jgi:hypothetical protein